MATEALREQVIPVARTRPMADRIFFSTMIVALWASVLYGFSKTYYMAGMTSAPLPNHLVHIHGAVMTLWMLLLLVQESFITVRKVAWHRTLGLFGFGLAVLMVGIGLAAGTDALRRGVGHLGLDPLTFYIIPVSAISLFAVFTFFAWRARRKPAAHKRLIVIGTIALMDAAVARWPVEAFHTKPPLMDTVIFGFLVAIIVFDLVTQKKVLKSTLWASLLLVAVHLTRVPLGMTHVWRAFAAKMLG